MVGALLLRGMLAGVLAGCLAFGLLKIAGEPAVDRAIAFGAQTAMAEAHSHGPAAPEAPAPEPELVGRAVQAGIGLLTGAVTYGAAFGGFFALAFALSFGRLGDFRPRAVAALLALLGFVAVYAVPILKYPANPPSVGDAETIGGRTALYFAMIALSLAAMILAGMLRARLQPRHGAWNAVLIAGGAYLAAMAIAGFALPAVDEVPDAFPAVVLWQFRVASMGAQVILWTTLGIVFGAAAERLLTHRHAWPARAAASGTK